MPILTASRTYLPGDLIYSEEPFVYVLPRDFKDELCESCLCRPFNLRACKQCLAVKYCGRPCQKKDWNIHRLECSHMKKLEEEKYDDLVRLFARIILKTKDKDWKSFKTSVLGNEVSFDDIDPRYKDMTENPELNLLFQELKERTRKFIGAGNMPSDIDVLKIAGKVLFNTFLNVEKSIPAVCFFIGMFKFEHECIANSSFIVAQKKLRIWATKKIDKGSEKITVSFRRLFVRHPHIFEYADIITCKCCDCSLPYGDGVLTKILDKKKAFSLIGETKSVLKAGSVFSSFGLEHRLSYAADEILSRHNGVLGRTNILHLKLLGSRCFQIGGRPVDIKCWLLELESIMRTVFGEFYSEMLHIYETLVVVNFQLGNISEGRLYLIKAEKLRNPQ